MGERGPVPKSRRERKLTGNAANRPLPKKTEPILHADDLPPCPGWIGKEGRAYWERIVPVLRSRMQLTSLDWPQLVQMCQAWDDFQSCTKQVQKQGRTNKTSKGNEVVNPSYKLMVQASNRFAKYAEIFCITPKARRRQDSIVQMQPVDGDSDKHDDLDEFLNG